MSNKTQLQTNNTALDALITRVNAAKDTAASLPDAGSGGGNVETCEVNLATQAPLIGVEQAWYCDGTSNVQSVSFPALGSTKSITVAKNTILCTNCTVKSSTPVVHSNNVSIFFISDNATLTFI